MPRNGSGIYSPPPGTTVVPNTLADATAMETRLSDIGAEISASMPLNGVRPMTAPLQVVPGSAAAPGLAFSGDTSSGLAQVGSRTTLVKGGVAGISSSQTDVQAHLPMTVGTLTVTTGVTGPGTVPPGAMMEFGGAAAPAGWLFCDGSAISRTAYAALFAAIGVLHGAGDGSTTFNLPDTRGTVTASPDNLGGTNAGRMTSAGAAATTVGGRYGADTHTLTGAQTGPHTHTGTTDSAGSHAHTVPTQFLNVATGGAFIAGSTGPGSINTSTDGAHVHPFITASAGGGTAHNNVQPTLFIPKIIKT